VQEQGGSLYQDFKSKRRTGKGHPLLSSFIRSIKRRKGVDKKGGFGCRQRRKVTRVTEMCRVDGEGLKGR